MGTPKTTIELNGKQYDARTGKIISDTTASTTPKQPVATKPNAGAVIDGFVKPTRSTVAPLAPTTKTKATTTGVNKTKRSVQKSQTLMRSGLKKPKVSTSAKPAAATVTRKSHGHVVREQRAETVAKSPLISKFGSTSVSKVVKKEGHLPVVAPAIQPKQLAKTAHNELEKIEHALHNATSHLAELEHSAIKKVPFLARFGFKNAKANVASMSLAVLLLTGFFAYQNAPAVEMRVAAARAGIDAQLPGYKPAGFGVSRGINVQPGKVSVNFISRTDDKQFTITQQASNWNSASLLANHVSRTRCNTCYQTWQNNGRTVYIYDNSNATWVSGGIWYEIKGDASLTSDQLLRLANSF